MTSTRDRVPAHTDADINLRIQSEIENRVRYYDQHRDRIPKRLQELDEEWDMSAPLRPMQPPWVLWGSLWVQPVTADGLRSPPS